MRSGVSMISMSRAPAPGCLASSCSIAGGRRRAADRTGDGAPPPAPRPDTARGIVAAHRVDGDSHSTHRGSRAAGADRRSHGTRIVVDRRSHGTRIVADRRSHGTRIVADRRSHGTRIVADRRSHGTRIVADRRSHGTWIVVGRRRGPMRFRVASGMRKERRTHKRFASRYSAVIRRGSAARIGG